jgi:predicted membrane channel-forming protein YqfA (hemolysin III family)
LPKKHSSNGNARLKGYVCAGILASLIGTYLDLWLVGKEFYTFPSRPFPSVFSVNILFTLGVLPVCIIIFIYLVKRLQPFSRFLFIAVMSLAVPLIEQLSEMLGLFSHSSGWKHEYSIFGYFIFLLVVWKFYRWVSKE